MTPKEDAASGETGPRPEHLENIRLPTEEARIKALTVLRKCRRVVTIAQNSIDVWRGVPTSVVDLMVAEGVKLERLLRY